MKLQDDKASRLYALAAIKKQMSHCEAMQHGQKTGDDLEYKEDDGLVGALCLKTFTAISIQCMERCTRAVLDGIHNRIKNDQIIAKLKPGEKPSDRFKGYYNFSRDYMICLLLEYEIDNNLTRKSKEVEIAWPDFEYDKVNLKDSTPEQEEQMKKYL